MSPATFSSRDPLRWSEHAACLEAPDLPWVADDPAPADVAAMALMCSSCPVRLACAGYATTAGVTGGFWAGQHRDPHRRGDVDDVCDTSTPSTPSTDRRVVWEALALPGLDLLVLDVLGVVA